jgi:hypothetical protein
LTIADSERLLKAEETSLRAAEVKNKAAGFVMDNRAVITTGTDVEQVLLRDIMLVTFPKEIYQPVCSAIARRAKSVKQIEIWNEPKSQPEIRDSPRIVQRVFLHYKAKQDSPILDSIMLALREQNFDVQGKQLVTQATGGDVRYFSGDDAETATKIKASVEEVLKKKSKSLNLKTIFAGKSFKNIPRGVYEVWLPQL